MAPGLDASAIALALMLPFAGSVSAQMYPSPGLIPARINNSNVVRSNTWLSAALEPNTTGFTNSSLVTYTHRKDEPNAYFTLLRKSGDVLDPSNQHAYSWSVNVSDVSLGQNRAIVNTVYELTISEENVKRMQTDGKELNILFVTKISNQSIATGQEDSGNCKSTLGVDCVNRLVEVFLANSSTGSIPPACHSIITSVELLSPMRAFEASLSSLQSSDFNSSNPDTDGFYWSLSDPSDANSREDYYTRFDNSSMSVVGGFVTRSALFSLASGMHDTGDNSEYFSAVQRITPIVVAQVDKDNPSGLADWASAVCIQAKNVTLGSLRAPKPVVKLNAANRCILEIKKLLVFAICAVAFVTLI